MAFGGVKGKLDYQMLEIKRFIAAHNIIDYQMNPYFPLNTLMLMRGAVVAEQEGRGADYIEMGFKAVWEEGLKMDELQIFVDRLAQDGFKNYYERTQASEVKAELMRATQAAVDRGVFGAPTYFVGDEIYFGKDRLADVEAQIVRQMS